ncbi:hypothetical protein A9Q86_11585 [Flavobacteriales bacterium 33_180_T64]|mgnify:CR=1 FL=1|nr:hypothetical protein A9Q86_11585 [Flavobacteriales bacterium 33_180_T64]
MNIIKFLRKPYLAILFSYLILFVSCSQYDSVEINEQNFDYTAFNEFKSQGYIIDINLIKNNKVSLIEKKKAILNQINTELNTDLSFPDKAFELANSDVEEIFEISMKEGWMTQQDVDLTNEFILNIKNDGIDIAISKYEATILELSLSSAKFEEKNIFLNIMKSLNYANPDLFKTELLNESLVANKEPWYKCAAAGVALVAATLSLASCVTVAACGLALVLVYAASNSVAAMCGGDE